MVVLAEEPASGATFYADAILDRLPGQDGTVLVVAPETVGWASNDDVWTPDELNDALDASLGGSTSDDVVTIFVSELIEPSASGGSAGLWLLAIAVVVVAVIGFVVWRSRRSSAHAQVLWGARRRSCTASVSLGPGSLPVPTCA